MAKKKISNQAFQSEENIAHQEKYHHDGDDNWNLAGTACPLGSPKINTNPGNGQVLDHAQKVMRPLYNDLDSSHIFESHKGK